MNNQDNLKRSGSFMEIRGTEGSFLEQRDSSYNVYFDKSRTPIKLF